MKNVPLILAVSGGSSGTERITIAAAATAIIALIAGLVLFKRGRRGPPD